MGWRVVKPSLGHWWNIQRLSPRISLSDILARLSPRPGRPASPCAMVPGPAKTSICEQSFVSFLGTYSLAVTLRCQSYCLKNLTKPLEEVPLIFVRSRALGMFYQRRSLCATNCVQTWSYQINLNGASTWVIWI